MDGFLDFLYVFLSFVVSTIYAGKAMRNCIDKKLYDEVTDRSSHKEPTPRGGGYSFVVVISIFSLLWINLGESLANSNFLNALFLCGAVIAYLGWRDDNQNVNPLLRFLCQFAVAITCTAMLPAFYPELLPFWIEKTVIVLAWVWFLNLYNFMDGIDGIASVEAVIITLALSMIMPSIGPILLVMLGSTLGFLRFNWAPARVFMGDIGSTYLGFVLAGLLFYNLQFKAESGIWVGLIITAVFTFDATYTLIKRTLKGEKPWQPHRDHFYQRASRAGLGHAGVVKRVIGLNIIFLLFAIIAHVSNLGPYLFITTILILSIVAWRVYRLEGK